MQSRSLSITVTDSDTLRKWLFTHDNNENAAALLCGLSNEPGEQRLLVRYIRDVPPTEYIERLPYHLEISPRFYNRIVDECLREKLTPVIVHSHPGAELASYSQSDDFGEFRLLNVLKELLPGTSPASLLLAPHHATGRYLGRKS